MRAKQEMAVRNDRSAPRVAREADSTGEEAPMKRTLLTIALVAAAGTAGAQTVSTPAGNVSAGAGAATSGGATVTTPPASVGATTNGGATMNSNTGMRGAQTQMNTNTQMNSNTPMPAGQL